MGGLRNPPAISVPGQCAILRPAPYHTFQSPFVVDQYWHRAKQVPLACVHPRTAGLQRPMMQAKPAQDDDVRRGQVCKHMSQCLTGARRPQNNVQLRAPRSDAQF